jgi:hypothetical protein
LWAKYNEKLLKIFYSFSTRVTTNEIIDEIEIVYLQLRDLSEKKTYVIDLSARNLKAKKSDVNFLS